MINSLERRWATLLAVMLATMLVVMLVMMPKASCYDAGAMYAVMLSMM